MRSSHSILDWLGARGWLVLTVMIVIVGGAFGFIKLASEVREGETKAFDEQILRALRQHDHPDIPIGPHWLGEVGRDITALGSMSVLAIFTGAVIGHLVFSRKTHAAIFLAGAVMGGVMIGTLLKQVFGRERPSVVPHLTEVYSSSFPSGHAMMSAVVYLTLGSLLMRLAPRRRLKLYYLCVAMFLTFLVGLSRMYMGVHYPTDVLAGWTAGLVWALLCWLAARWLQRKGAVEKDTGERVSA